MEYGNVFIKEIKERKPLLTEEIVNTINTCIVNYSELRKKDNVEARYWCYFRKYFPRKTKEEIMDIVHYALYKTKSK